MGALKKIRKSLILVACSFIVAMAGMFLYDGATGETFAFTTADCRVCHDEPGWPRPYGGTVNNAHHKYLPRGCSACHKTTTPVTTDPTHPDYQCNNCHYPGSTLYSIKHQTILNVTQAHTPVHDNTDVPDPATCVIACHDPDVIVEHNKYPQFAAPDGEMDCDRCHKNTNTDESLGPINVQQTIAKGSLGPPPVICTECHTTISGQGHAAAHVEYKADSASCNAVGCHDVNIMTEHVDNRGWTCNTCHLGETLSLDPAVVLQVVADAIAASPNPPDMNCSSCHGAGAGMHEAAHDQGFFLMTPSIDDACTKCHAGMDPLVDPNWANLVKEHVTNQGFTCATCHDQQVVDLDPTDVFNAINKGRDPSNMPVYCIDCHTDAISGQGKGHRPVTFEPWSECTWCHTLEIFEHPEHTMHLAAAQDLQQDCSVCHVPDGERPDCVQCHSLEQTIWDPLPVHRTAPNNSLNIIGPGTEDHDRHTSGIDCSYCHVSGVPGSEPLPVPYSECSKCHNGGTATDISYGSTVHTVNHIQGAEALGQGCAYCHSQAPACTDCHDIKGPNKPKHDIHTDTFQYNCMDCHINGIAGSTPLPPPYDECATCHMSAGPGSDITYGSAIHTNNHIPGGEASGQSCYLCHETQTPDCSSCHAPGHPPIPPPNDQCSTCHDGTGGTINIKYGEIGHDKHMAVAANNCALCHNPQPNCAQCHTAGDHVGAHDNAGVPSPGCMNCHDANVVVEHVDNRGYECATCHGSTDQKVIDAIAAGKAGTFVYCYDCHGQNNHHATAESQSGNCTYCHADPRLEVDANAPKGQLACRQCHGANQHNNGGPIQDYGACFACHQPTPYHAKPTTWPGWYGENAQTPGRGSFNLFYSQFRPSCASKDCEGTKYENMSGYGEDRPPAKDKGSKWRTPAISYSMVTFFDHFNTKKQWTVPTFGSGGGTPPPQQDSINITRAEYKDRRLEVYAENTLKNNATLSLAYEGRTYQMTWNSGNNRWEIRISDDRCTDSTIDVTSSAGGTASRSVSGCSGSYSSSYGGWSN